VAAYRAVVTFTLAALTLGLFTAATTVDSTARSPGVAEERSSVEPSSMAGKSRSSDRSWPTTAASLAAASTTAGTVTITDSAITGSTGYTGLGIYNSGGFVELNGSTTITGGSGRYAGGIYNTGTLVMRDATTVSGNVTENGGGMTNTGIVRTYGRSTIAGNTAFYGTTVTPGPGEGGGMTNSGTVELFDESSITGNRADNYGGGIFNTVTLWGTTTVTRNDAGTLGGGVYNDGGSLTILPTASVSDNTPDDTYNVP
jgi:hypothetical protein